MFELEFEPVYVLLVGFFVVGVALIFFGKKKDDGSVGVPTTSDASDSIVQPPLDTLQTMTLTQLAEFNGQKSSKTYLACKGIVFDVTGSEFYVGEGGYSAFAGKDCSVNLARMSFEVKDYNQYGNEDLNLSERDILDQWYAKYFTKYRVVAKIGESKKDN